MCAWFCCKGKWDIIYSVTKFRLKGSSILTEPEKREGRKTRPAYNWFQDCCKDCSLNQVTDVRIFILFILDTLYFKVYLVSTYLSYYSHTCLEGPLYRLACFQSTLSLYHRLSLWAVTVAGCSIGVELRSRVYDVIIPHIKTVTS